MKNLFLASAIAVGSILNVQAQSPALKTPAPSPTQTLKQDFALSSISIEYSRPSVKGRTIFGDVVPYGKTWRTGANASTKITFGEDVKVEGKAVPAGTYALYTIPNKDSWEIMLYKDLSIAGRVAEYKTENELTRFTVKPTSLSQKVETLTLNVADVTSSTAVIEITWDKVRVAFTVVADIDSKIMKNIETALATDSRPYFQAANYYYETDKDPKQALDWVNKAIDANPKAFWMIMLKAKIQLKLKDNAGAIASAEQVNTLAKEAQNDDYQAMAQKLIVEAKKK
ncbi:MAG TPA: DUF2911 domain-containing protein [Cytophagaceae bacterium]|nr:DUF2911 domain-containing protein [Cytophagaceae bacterium]